MNVNANALIAFLAKDFNVNNPALAKLVCTKLRIGGQQTYAIRPQHLKDVCKALKVPLGSVELNLCAGYSGVYLAQVVRGVLSKPEQAKKAKQDLAVRTQRTKEQYVDLCCRPRINVLQNIEKQIRDVERRIGDHQQGLITKIRELNNKRSELEVMTKAQSTPEIKEAEFDQLMKHPDIEFIEINENKLEAYTKYINILHNKRRYSIGKFKITMKTDGSSPIIKMINITSKQGEYQHPHVDQGGFPCLGNIKECLPAMIAEYHFAAAIAVCVQYLKSYTHDETGSPFTEISNWPRMVKRGINAQEKTQEAEGTDDEA